MSNTFEIKICGISDKSCMVTALECKVDYIGLVFYEKSPRNITIENSKKLLDNRNKFSKIEQTKNSEVKNKIRLEAQTAINKDVYINPDDAEIINKFLDKIKSDLKQSN